MGQKTLTTLSNEERLMGYLDTNKMRLGREDRRRALAILARWGSGATLTFGEWDEVGALKRLIKDAIDVDPAPPVEPLQRFKERQATEDLDRAMLTDVYNC